MNIRNMFPIGLFVLLAALLFTTAGRSQSNRCR
jgi:hypothetical protein